MKFCCVQIAQELITSTGIRFTCPTCNIQYVSDGSRWCKVMELSRHKQQKLETIRRVNELMEGRVPHG